MYSERNNERINKKGWKITPFTEGMRNEYVQRLTSDYLRRRSRNHIPPDCIICRVEKEPRRDYWTGEVIHVRAPFGRRRFNLFKIGERVVQVIYTDSGVIHYYHPECLAYGFQKECPEHLDIELWKKAKRRVQNCRRYFGDEHTENLRIMLGKWKRDLS